MQLKSKVESEERDDVIIQKREHFYLVDNLSSNKTYMFQLVPIPVNDTIFFNTTNNRVNVTMVSDEKDMMDLTLRLRISKLLSKITNINVINDSETSPLAFVKEQKPTISYLQPMIIAIVVACLAIFILILLLIFIIVRTSKDGETNTYWVNGE